MVRSQAIAGAFAESAFCSNASGGPNSSRKPEDMMSDKCAPALDISVEEQDSFDSFGEDGVQALLSLALADPERAKERFPAYRLTRLVTARFDMDDTEATIFADLARPLATVRPYTTPPCDHGGATDARRF